MAKRIKVASDQRPFVMTYWDFIECDLFDWNEKRIFIILKKFADSNNQCFPSIKTLCKLSQLSRNTVKKTLKSMEEKKVIAIEHRKDKENSKSQSHLYTLYDYPELWNAESIEQTTETVDIEELQLFELAKKKGYRLEKERELASNTDQSIEASTININKNSLTKNNTKKTEESQEKVQFSLPKIKDFYAYDKMIQEHPYQKQEIDSVINILYTTLNTDKPTIRISGKYTNTEKVKEKLKKLNSELIIYVLEKFKEQTTKIKNPTSYLLTMLYHSLEQFPIDKINQEAQKNKKPQKNSNQFTNFEQHNYTSKDYKEMEKILLKKAEKRLEKSKK